MSLLLEIINDARGDAARERAELVARIGADLARLDLLDWFAAPGAEPFGDSGRNPLALSFQLGRATTDLPAAPAAGSALRRIGYFLMAGG